MTWFWLLLAGTGQPLAMEAYRWAPAWTDDAELARLLVRWTTLAGPVVILAAMSCVPVGHETKACNEIRSTAWAAALFLLLVAVWSGLERNAPYRVAFLAQQVLLAMTWWCTVVGERRARHRVAHFARLAGLLWACLGVVLCVACQFILAWGTMGGTVPAYDPWLDTHSQAGILGLHPFTMTLVLGSLIAIPLLVGLDRCGAAATRRIQAQMLRVGR